MAVKRLARKLLKTGGIVMAILLALLVAAWFWFTHHAGSILRDIVRSRSNGTVELSLKSISYNFSDRRLSLREAVIYNTDSASKKTAYRVSVKKLTLQLHRLTPLLLRRELVIDSILINNPDISVMKSDTLERRHGSLTHEIGDVYHSIQQALSLFQVDHLRIVNGRFSLNNRAKAGWLPVSISNIYFGINNIQVGGNKVDTSAFHFTEDIEFRTDHQLITFPDNQYRLGFSHFRLHVRNREITLDSCSVASTGARQQQLSLNLFFDRLRFSNIDFAALYANGEIRADSAYATNPVINLQLKVDSNPRRRSDLPPVPVDTLLRHLGVNMHLQYIGVKNANTSVVTVQGGRSAEFKTRGDDFEVRELVIDRRAKDPVSIGRFDMAIRGYSSLNKDSTYRFKFDSIRIVNSNILLNNFTITSLEGAPVERHHELPVLELDSLSWEALLFDRHIQAKQAILHRPEIRYVRRGPVRGKKPSLFSILNSLDNVMSLERIRVIDGQVSYEPNPGTRLLLDRVDLTVQTNRLLAARTSSMMGDAVDSLHFAKGSISTRKLQATINGGSFLGNGTHLRADNAVIRDRSGNLTIHAKGLHLAGLDFDDNNDHFRIDYLSWKEATVTLQARQGASPRSRPLPLSILARQVDGGPTHLSYATDSSSLQTQLSKVSLRGVSKQAGRDATIDVMVVAGRNLQYAGKGISCQTGDYSITDRAASYVNDLRITHTNPYDSLVAGIPTLHFVPDGAALMDGRLHMGAIVLQSPIIWAKLGNRPGGATGKAGGRSLPVFDIDELRLEQPSIQVEQQKDSHTLRLAWNRGDLAARNRWIVKDLRHDGRTPPTIGQVNIAGTAVSFVRQGRSELALKPQSIELVLSNTLLAAGHAAAAPWSTQVDHFAIRDLVLEGLGKDSGRLHLASLTLEHLALQARQPVRAWIDQSPGFFLRDLSGEYRSTRNLFRWKALRYQQALQLLSVDSFSYRPVPDRDAYVASKRWQTDYIQLQTGRIDLHRPDLYRLLNDSVVQVASLQVHNPDISVYRDKRPPRKPDVIRQLPVNQIRNIPFRLQLDSIWIRNGRVTYEEHSEKTDKPGTIPITQLNALLAHVRNFSIEDRDSLKLLANAHLFDSIHVSLRLDESYTDSLAAFVMTTRVGPANLLLLNPAVEPLASVRIRSGYLDTLTMRAVGREYLAYGEMRMLYRRLNVEFLQKGDAEKKTFVTKVITFIANSFVIKSRNRGKTGIVYFERLRDRSIFNYMIKMLLSGAGSSIGAKSNKKYLKRYKRELHRQQLPAIHYQ